MSEQRFERVSGRTRVVVFFDGSARMTNREDAARGFHRCDIFRLDGLVPGERFDSIIVSAPPALVEKHGIESDAVFEYVARCSLLHSLADRPELVVERDEKTGDLVFRESPAVESKSKRRPRSLQRITNA